MSVIVRGTEGVFVTREPEQDRRGRRTHQLLHDAIAALIHDKRYDSIAVKEILGRANVGRSAFYTHFRDKHVLLASGIAQVMHEGTARTLPPDAMRFRHVLRFSLPVLEYVDGFRHGGGPTIAGETWATVHLQLRQVIADAIADDVRASLPLQPGAAAPG